MISYSKNMTTLWKNKDKTKNDGNVAVIFLCMIFKLLECKEIIH